MKVIIFLLLPDISNSRLGFNFIFSIPSIILFFINYFRSFSDKAFTIHFLFNLTALFVCQAPNDNQNAQLYIIKLKRKGYET
jgi:hypothetical protein